MALFPQFIDPTRDHWPQFLVLGITTVTIDAIVMFGYTALAAQLGRYIRSPNIMTRMNKLFGSMFMGCGMLLATAKA
ncbi:homoserine/homoserine lactone efflux protein [Vibrio cholerae]|nr:homoserine/homoserine lactone efflux protein [Vibrio cholerae HC-55A1]CSI63550.1 homoserine/homoserine lactone efflux protein [Vibrio cholerae]